VTQISVFIGVSLDGYIATMDDRLDWLDQAAAEGEDYGFDAFLLEVDALAMGRGTWDQISALDVLPFGGRPIFVFTHKPPASDRREVTFFDLDPQSAVDRWDELGLGHVYLDGGKVISDFLEAGLVDDLQLTTAPILLGRGRPLFHPIGRRTDLFLDAVETFPSGMVSSHYTTRG